MTTPNPAPTRSFFLLLGLLTLGACTTEAERDGSDALAGDRGQGDACEPLDSVGSGCWSDIDFSCITETDSGICDWIDSLDDVARDSALGLYGDGAGWSSNNVPRDGTIQWKDGRCSATVPNAAVGAEPVCGDDNDDCVCTPGGNCTLTVSPQRLAEVFSEQEVLADQKALCDQLTVAHLRCAGELPRNVVPSGGSFAYAVDPCDTPSSCHKGLEIDCQRYQPSWATSPEPHQFLLPESACTGQTVNGLGYYDYAGYRLELGSCLGQDPGPATNQVVECSFLGHQFPAAQGFCSTLNECVEPRLEVQAGYRPGGGSGQLLTFPSGPATIAIDNSCGDLGANHRSGICRAIDINVTRNGGNLIGGNVRDPEVNMPPAFVAIMEDCGLVWGGRYQAALQSDQTEGPATPGLCDPMHFDYAPCCIVDPVVRQAMFGDVSCG